MAGSLIENITQLVGKSVKPAKSAVKQGGAAKSTPSVYNDGGTIKYTYNGKTYSVNPAGKGGFMQAFDAYVNDAAKAKNVYEGQFATNKKNLAATLAQNNATTNANYDNSARQAYVDYMRKQKALPSQLQALGVRGGATESGLLNLYNNYGTEHAANEQQRNADLTANRQAYNDAYNKLVSDRSAYLMDYEKDLAAQRQTALNNQMNEYRNELTTYSASIARFAATEKGYKEAKAELKRLKNSKDPLKAAKINILKQQMTSVFTPDVLNGFGGGSSSGGSSGGSGGSGYRRSGGGYSRRSGGYSNNSYSSDNDERPATNRQGNSVGDYYVGSKTTGKKKSKTKSIKGDTYTITKRGSYRQR